MIFIANTINLYTRRKIRLVNLEVNSKLLLLALLATTDLIKCLALLFILNLRIIYDDNSSLTLINGHSKASNNV